MPNPLPSFLNAAPLTPSRRHKVFAADFGNLSGLVKHRPSNTLVPLLGEIVQSYTTLIMLFRGYQSLQATRWSIWVKRGAMGVLTLGWVANLVGGIAVCTQIKVLSFSFFRRVFFDAPNACTDSLCSCRR